MTTEAPATTRRTLTPPREPSRVRVLWLVKGLGLGGAEQLVRMCVPRFDPAAFEVDVAYVLAHKDALVGHLQDRGVRVRCLSSAGHWVPALRRLLDHGAYDVVHTHSPVAAVVTRMMVRPGEARLVHTEHNVWERFRTPTRVTNALTYDRNAHVFGVSAGVVTSIRTSPWARTLPSMEVLHHGIDESLVRRGPDARRRAREQLGLGVDEVVLGSVANFTPKKDHRTLLEAFGRVLATGRRARLVLVGAGPLLDEMRAVARDAGLADHVVFTGPVPDVPALLPALDLFVLTSLHEGLPIALLEAMATGIPSVVTPVGGTTEMLEDGVHGVFVPCGAPDDVATALSALIDDDALRARMGTASIEAARRFSVDAAVARMQEVYAELVPRPHTGAPS